MSLKDRLRQTLERVFAPSGNLLVADLTAEVAVHVLSNGQRKTLIAKMDDLQAAHHAVQGLVFGAIEVGQQHGVSVNWIAMNRLAPYPGAEPCHVCKEPVLATEPAVWVSQPPRFGHLRCAVVVEDQP